MSNKFCTECGTKNVPVGGVSPKFCSNCGNSLVPGGAPAQSLVEEQPKEVSLEVSSFEIEGSAELDHTVFNLSSLLGQGKTGVKRQRGKDTDLKALLERARSTEVIDAER